MFILDYTKLNYGDVILVSNPSKYAPFIKLFTNSQFTHVLICVGNTLMHAMPDGVYTTNPQRIVHDSPKNIKVLRLNQKVKFTEQHLKTACTYARNLSGSLYNKIEAALSPSLNSTHLQANTNQQYCSRLIAQSYRHAGLNLVKNPDHCTPEDLNKCAYFSVVSDAVREATIEEVEFSKSDDPVYENMRRNYEWLNKARALFAAKGIDIQTNQDVKEALCAYPQYDGIICQYLDSSGFLDHYNFDKLIPENKYRYNQEEMLHLAYSFASRNISNVFIEAVIKPNLDMCKNEISKHAHNMFASGFEASYWGLGYSKRFFKMHSDIIEFNLERLHIILSVLTDTPLMIENNVKEVVDSLKFLIKCCESYREIYETALE